MFSQLNKKNKSIHVLKSFILSIVLVSSIVRTANAFDRRYLLDGLFFVGTFVGSTYNLIWSSIESSSIDQLRSTLEDVNPKDCTPIQLEEISGLLSGPLNNTGTDASLQSLTGGLIGASAISAFGGFAVGSCYLLFQNIYDTGQMDFWWFLANTFFHTPEIGVAGGLLDLTPSPESYDSLPRSFSEPLETLKKFAISGVVVAVTPMGVFLILKVSPSIFKRLFNNDNFVAVSPDIP